MLIGHIALPDEEGLKRTHKEYSRLKNHDHLNNWDCFDFIGIVEKPRFSIDKTYFAFNHNGLNLFSTFDK